MQQRVEDRHVHDGIVGLWDRLFSDK